MARMPGALWRPIPASATPMSAHDIICIHTMVMSLVDCDAYFRRIAPGVNSHYGTGHDGEKRQWVDTRFRSGANYSGNHRVISVENADRGPGFPVWNPNDGSQVPAFTAAQVEAIAEILAWESSPEAHAACPPSWACHREGIPLSLIPDAKPGRRGIGYHRQGVPGYMVAGAEQWSTSRGKVCPGDRRIAQIPQIIARARELANGDDDMDANQVWQGDGAPMVHNYRLNRGEYPATILGSLEGRIQREILPPALAPINAALSKLMEIVANDRDFTPADLRQAVTEGVKNAAAGMRETILATVREALAADSRNEVDDVADALVDELIARLTNEPAADPATGPTT